MLSLGWLLGRSGAWRRPSGKDPSLERCLFGERPWYADSGSRIELLPAPEMEPEGARPPDIEPEGARPPEMEPEGARAPDIEPEGARPIEGICLCSVEAFGLAEMLMLLKKLVLFALFVFGLLLLAEEGSAGFLKSKSCREPRLKPTLSDWRRKASKFGFWSAGMTVGEKAAVDLTADEGGLQFFLVWRVDSESYESSWAVLKPK
jgi:hypothetical protein